MNKNIGRTDKIIRIAIGLTIICAGIYFGSWWGAIGLAPIITAFIGWCPAYLPLGLSTCKKPDN